MKIEVRNDAIHISGYVNCVNRPSKRLREGGEEFIEIMEAGVFRRALELNPVDLLINHKNNKKVGDTLTNMKLEEDEIGLRIEADITDAETIEAFKAGNIRQMSFGFICKDSYDKIIEGVKTRFVRAIELFEVSLLDRLTPAYTGSLVQMRSEEESASPLNVVMEIRTDDISYEIKEEIIEEESDNLEEEKKSELIDETLNDTQASDTDIQEASKDKAENQIEMIEDLKKFIMTEKIKNEIKAMRV